MKNTANWILLVLGIFSFAFIVTMIVVFCIKDGVPDTLITCTLGAGGFEALMLAGIKVSKVVKGTETKTNVEDDYEPEGND